MPRQSEERCDRTSVIRFTASAGRGSYWWALSRLALIYTHAYIRVPVRYDAANDDTLFHGDHERLIDAVSV